MSSKRIDSETGRNAGLVTRLAGVDLIKASPTHQRKFASGGGLELMVTGSEVGISKGKFQNILYC